MTINPKRTPWSDPPPPKPFGGTLGVIAIAFGIGLAGAYVFDWHHHVCDKCGYRWGHLGAFNAGDERAHTCLLCGQTQWWKESVPHAFRAAHDAHASYYDPQSGAVSTSQEFRGPHQHALPSGR